MIILINSEKHFSKFNSHLYVKENLSKIGIVENFLNLIKNIYRKHFIYFIP